MLRRLECTLGLSDSVICLIQTYISDHSRYVHVGQKQSTTVLCKYGVLCSLLCTLYVVPFASVIASFDFNHTQYADDTQLLHCSRKHNITIWIVGLH